MDFPLKEAFPPSPLHVSKRFRPEKLFKLPKFVHLANQSHCFTTSDGFNLLVKFMFYMRIIRDASLSVHHVPTFHLPMCFATHAFLYSKYINQQHIYIFMIVILIHNDSTQVSHPEPTKPLKENSYHLYLTVLQHASFKQRVFPLEEVSGVRQCRGEKLAPLWPLAVGLGPASGEVGDTGMSKAGLGMCKAARLLFFERLLVWRGGELEAWRGPQLVESSGEGSGWGAGPASGQAWAGWGFPWGQEVDSSGERVADSSRPLVPCVHWGGTRGEREKEEKTNTGETSQWHSY